MPFKNPHPLYNVWQSMRGRCMNPNCRQWSDYGGRGISICKRWDDFHTFVRDMGPRPDGYSIDRIDNDGDYSPENCRWASKREQQRNQRCSRYVCIDGKQYRAVDLAEQIGVKTDTIVKRAKRGLSYPEVMSAKPFTNRSGLSLGGMASGKKKQALRHCANGHDFTPENTSYTKQGWRICKTCKRERAREDRRKAAERAAG